MCSHKTRLARSAVAGLLSVLMVIPLSGGIASSRPSSLSATRKKIAEIRKKLAAAKGKATAIRSQVGALDAQIGSLNKQIRSEEREISQLESDIRSAGAQIHGLESAYRRAVEASNARARMLYKTGPATALERIFSSRSIAEAVRVQVWWEKSSEVDGKTILDANRLKAELAERRQDLSHFKSRLEERKREVEARRDLATGAKADRSIALHQVEAEIHNHEKDLAALEADSRRLTSYARTNLSKSRGPEVGAASKSGFTWPVRGAVTSSYGRRGRGFHSGMDIDGNTGDPIRAAKSGSVAAFSCGSGYGTCVVIDHGGGVSSLYAHMSRRSVGSGSVSAGQVIGFVGCTGSCTGSHLHFEVRVNGSPRNPRSFLP